LPNLKYYSGVFFEKLRKATDIPSQGMRCSGRDSNQSPVKYRSEALVLKLFAEAVDTVQYKVPLLSCPGCGSRKNLQLLGHNVTVAVPRDTM
jgi:hypothetical protein